MKHVYIILLAILFSVKVNAQCQAAFTFTNTGNTFNFTDASTTSSGNIISWLWNFGDLSAPSTTQNPSHTFVACGNFTVSLTIFTSSFCSSTFSDTVLVNGGITASYTATVDTTTGTVNFTAQPNSPLLNYTWDFGDASTGTGQNTSHQYATSGNYVVCLTVADTGGICTDSICSTVVVYIAPASCNATFTNNLTGVGMETFTATPFNLGWTYSWDFGDSNTGTGFFTQHQYTASGTYTVCLTVTDSATSCSSQFCDTVNIIVPTTCPPTFTATSLNGIYAFTGSPFSIQNTYTWDFGDASAPGNGVITQHTYTASGTYTVCLTMSTPSGCTGTFCDTVNVVIAGVQEQSASFPVTIFPNPANDHLTLDYYLPSTSAVTIEVLDLAGRTLVTSFSSQQTGYTHEEINIEHLATGTYLLRVSTSGATENLIFVKE